MQDPEAGSDSPTVMVNRVFARVSAATAVVLLGAGVLPGCRADADVVEVLQADEPDMLDVIVDTCNADLDVTVEESDTEVVLKVRNNDRELFDTGGDACLDAVRIKLASPLGDRAVVDLGNGTEIPISTIAIDSGETDVGQ